MNHKFSQTSLKMTANNEEEILARPILHSLQAGSENRNISKQFVRSFNFWIRCPKDARKTFIEIGDGFQELFVVSDDILDETILRRGIPAAHLVYGIALSVQATIHRGILLLQNLLCCAGDSKDDTLDDLIKLGIKFCTGQGLEIYYRNTEKCPTFDDFRVIMHNKSTETLIWAVQILNLCAKNEKIDFSADLCEKIGQFQQIYDDYINLHNPKYAAVRVFCDDLDEGKFSYPIIHGVQSHPDDHRLLDMLKKRPLDVESKKLFVDILESFGSFEHTRKVLKELKDGIFDDVDKMNMGKNPYLERVLQNVFGNLETEIYYDGCD
ncbi:hypothetical protein Zmor_009967 [Zophobas morio]|uniref:Geranylgeranyl pyrophosphate synthase n=1 Tax=Zophobas morio TaxID=2755281 RepID=A0AA38IRL7_9CUCU|nr:hypothetical protein Zmor_009967 [Zophobas morio]